jgi:hypothetical protein
MVCRRTFSSRTANADEYAFSACESGPSIWRKSSTYSSSRLDDAKIVQWLANCSLNR